MLNKESKVCFGDAGYRSPCLSHAKRALYHLSYTPVENSKKLYIKFSSARERITTQYRATGQLHQMPPATITHFYFPI